MAAGLGRDRIFISRHQRQALRMWGSAAGPIPRVDRQAYVLSLSQSGAIKYRARGFGWNILPEPPSVRLI